MRYSVKSQGRVRYQVSGSGPKGLTLADLEDLVVNLRRDGAPNDLPVYARVGWRSRATLLWADHVRTAGLRQGDILHR